jgi:hypothetical protein
MADRLTTRPADLSASKPPRWAWAGRIVLDALNLIVGNEGAGKGTLACWILARLTRGGLEGDLYGKPASVGIIGDEDDFQDTWTPRLHAAGADLDRVVLIERGDGGLVELAADRSHLAEIVRAKDIKLLYLDALIDVLGAATDDWRNKQVREALAPARQIARENGCAVLGSLHPNKSGGTFRQLVSGSIAFNAVSRSSLLLAAHPDDPDRRVLVRGKGNLSAAPPAVEFGIESFGFQANGHTFNVPLADDFALSTLTADDLLSTPVAPPPAGAARSEAREMIAGWLGDGDWHPAGLILAECERVGIHARAARRAADDLGIEKEKRGFPAASHWRLTGQSSSPAQSVRSVRSVPSGDLALIGRGDREDRLDRGQRGQEGVPSEECEADALIDLDGETPLIDRVLARAEGIA